MIAPPRSETAPLKLVYPHVVYCRMARSLSSKFPAALPRTLRRFSGMIWTAACRCRRWGRKETTASWKGHLQHSPSGGGRPGRCRVFTDMMQVAFAATRSRGMLRRRPSSSRTGSYVAGHADARRDSEPGAQPFPAGFRGYQEELRTLSVLRPCRPNALPARSCHAPLPAPPRRNRPARPADIRRNPRGIIHCWAKE